MRGISWVEKLCILAGVQPKGERMFNELTDKEEARQQRCDRNIWKEISFYLCDSLGVEIPELDRLLKIEYPAYKRSRPSYFLDRIVSGYSGYTRFVKELLDTVKRVRRKDNK